MPESSSNPIIEGDWLPADQRHRPLAASNEVLEHGWNEHREHCAAPSTDDWPEVQSCPVDRCAVIFVCTGCGCVTAIGLGDTWCDFVEAERVHQFGD